MGTAPIVAPAPPPADPNVTVAQKTGQEPLRDPGNPALIALLDKVAKVCDVQPWGARITCPNREEDGIRNWFFVQKKSLNETLDTFTMYIVMHDEKGQAVAVDALRRIVNNLDPKDFDLVGDLQHAIEPAIWHHFYTDIQKIQNPRLFIALDSALAVLAALAKQEQMLFNLLERHPAVRLRAIPHLLRFARLRPFESFKKLTDEAVTAGDLPLTKACLSAVARIPAVTPAEQKVLCPWVAEIFAQAPEHLWTSVATVFKSCPADLLEPLVSHLEREWTPQKAVASEVAVVGDLMRAHCTKEPEAKPAPICERLKQTVAKIKDSPKTLPEVRKVCEGVLPSKPN